MLTYCIRMHSGEQDLMLNHWQCIAGPAVEVILVRILSFSFLLCEVEQLSPDMNSELKCKLL